MKYPIDHPVNQRNDESAAAPWGAPSINEMIATNTRFALSLDERSQRFGDRLVALEQRAASAQPTQPWTSFGDFLGAVYRAAVTPGSDRRLIESRAASGLTGGEAPDTGAFLIPGEFSNALMAMVGYAAPIASRVMNIPAKRRSISLPAIDETSRADGGSRFGGIVSTWSQEGDTAPASKPKFRLVDLQLKRLMALLYGTEELIEDASALGAYVANAFTAEAAFQLDSMLVSGSGAGQPLGMLNAPGLITASKDAGQTAGTLVPANVANMFSRMLPECRARAVFLVSPEAEEALYASGFTNASGTWNNMFTAADVAAPFGRLMSRPILPVEQCSALGTVGDIIFADLTMIAAYERGIDLKMSVEVRFVNGECVFRMIYRVDATPIVKSPITQKNGGPTKSAYVALATRS